MTFGEGGMSNFDAMYVAPVVPDLTLYFILNNSSVMFYRKQHFIHLKCSVLPFVYFGQRPM